MAVSSPNKSSLKRKSALKTKNPVKRTRKAKNASHPKFIDMIVEGLHMLDEKSGSSRQAILKFMIANYPVDQKFANQYLKLALKNGVKSGVLKQLRGVGASGSFKLADTTTKPKNLSVKSKIEIKPSEKKSLSKPSKTAVKKKTVTKESAAAQLPSAPANERKPPTVRDQVIVKKSRSKKPAAKKGGSSTAAETQAVASAAQVEEKKAEPEKQVRVSARRSAEAMSKRTSVATRGKKRQSDTDSSQA